jgi:hypothetical protein
LLAVDQFELVQAGGVMPSQTDNAAEQMRIAALDQLDVLD